MLVLHRAFVFVGMTIASVMLAACARSVQPSPSLTGDSVESITTGDVVRQYNLHLPPSYAQSQPTPLVINLHGYDSKKNDGLHSDFAYALVSCAVATPTCCQNAATVASASLASASSICSVPM